MTRIALFAREFQELGLGDDLEPEGDGAPTDSDEADFDLVQLRVEMSEVIWVDRHYYVQALVDGDESVLAFAVTTRHRRFRPKYEGPSPPSWLERARILSRFRRGGYTRQPLLTVRLLKTRFAALDNTPRATFANLGLRRFNYAEAHWFGNPGAYQHFVLAWNDAGASSSGWPDPTLIFGEGMGVFRTGAWAAGPHPPSPNEVLDFRRQSTFNTYAVVGPRFHIEDFPVSFGPDLDEVRTID